MFFSQKIKTKFSDNYRFKIKFEINKILMFFKHKNSGFVIKRIYRRCFTFFRNQYKFHFKISQP